MGAIQVLGTLHQLPVILISAKVFHEHLSGMNLFGYAFCILAAFVYAYARRSEKLREARHASKVDAVQNTNGECGHSVGKPASPNFNGSSVAPQLAGNSATAQD